MGILLNKSKSKKVRKKIGVVIKIIRRSFAYFFIRIAKRLLGKKHKYMFIEEIVEDLLHDPEDPLKIVKVIEHNPLVTKFVTSRKHSISPYLFDEKYLRKELSLQMGCQETDIEIQFWENQAYIYITNTAIENVEKGITRNPPAMFLETAPDPLIDEARKIILKEQDFSIILLMDKLKISHDRAVKIIDDLKTLSLETEDDDKTESDNNLN